MQSLRAEGHREAKRTVAQTKKRTLKTHFGGCFSYAKEGGDKSSTAGTATTRFCVGRALLRANGGDFILVERYAQQKIEAKSYRHSDLTKTKLAKRGGGEN